MNSETVEMQCNLCGYLFQPKKGPLLEAAGAACPICGTKNDYNAAALVEQNQRNDATRVDFQKLYEEAAGDPVPAPPPASIQQLTEKIKRSELIPEQGPLPVTNQTAAKGLEPMLPELGNDVEASPRGKTTKLVRTTNREHVVGIVANRYGVAPPGSAKAKARPIMSRENMKRLSDPVSGKDPVQALSPRARRRRLENMMRLNADLDRRHESLLKRTQEITSQTSRARDRDAAPKEKIQRNVLAKGAGDISPIEEGQTTTFKKSKAPGLQKGKQPTTSNLEDGPGGFFLTELGICDPDDSPGTPHRQSSLKSSPIESPAVKPWKPQRKALLDQQEEGQLDDGKSQRRARMGLNPSGAAKAPKKQRVPIWARGTSSKPSKGGVSDHIGRGVVTGRRSSSGVTLSTITEKRKKDQNRNAQSPRSVKSDPSGLKAKIAKADRELQRVRATGAGSLDPGARKRAQARLAARERRRAPGVVPRSSRVSPLRANARRGPTSRKDHGWVTEKDGKATVEEAVPVDKRPQRRKVPVNPKLKVRETRSMALRNKKKAEEKKKQEMKKRKIRRKKPRIKKQTKAPMEDRQTFLTGLEEQEPSPGQAILQPSSTRSRPNRLRQEALLARGRQEFFGIEEEQPRGFLPRHIKNGPNKQPKEKRGNRLYQPKARMAWNDGGMKDPSLGRDFGGPAKAGKGKNTRRNRSFDPYLRQVAAPETMDILFDAPKTHVKKAKKPSFRTSIRETIQQTVQEAEEMKRRDRIQPHQYNRRRQKPGRTLKPLQNANMSANKSEILRKKKQRSRALIDHQPQTQQRHSLPIFETEDPPLQSDRRNHFSDQNDGEGKTGDLVENISYLNKCAVDSLSSIMPIHNLDQTENEFQLDPEQYGRFVQRLLEKNEEEQNPVSGFKIPINNF